MTNILINQYFVNDEERREALFRGNLLFYQASEASLQLISYAQHLIDKAFTPYNPQSAQEHLEVEEFVKRVGPLKSEFTNAEEVKILIQKLLESYNCDLEKTLFDVPRLRVASYDGFLTAGVGYAYKPHRDTWYASPHSQINWWLPVHELVPERAMSFFPYYWNSPVKNSSTQFDYQEWCEIGRKQASLQIKTDSRRHPIPLEDISRQSEIRFGCQAGGITLFSAAHLHETAPNTSGMIRFSIDFRTLHQDDLLAGRGAPNIDSRSKGSTIGDFIRASDFSDVPDELIEKSFHQATPAYSTVEG